MASNKPAAAASHISMRWLHIIWPFIATVALLLLLSYASLHVMAGMRAFVSAESLWSKAQKTAVSHLEQYAQTRNEDHFDRYIEEARVVAGARMARIELEKPFPDFDIARAGLLDARNDPTDIDGMIVLFRRFRPVGFMAGGVRIWTEADALFGRIEALAQEIHALIRSGRGNTGDLEPELVELRTLDRALTTLERSFAPHAARLKAIATAQDAQRPARTRRREPTGSECFLRMALRGGLRVVEPDHTPRGADSNRPWSRACITLIGAAGAGGTGVFELIELPSTRRDAIHRTVAAGASTVATSRSSGRWRARSRAAWSHRQRCSKGSNPSLSAPAPSLSDEARRWHPSVLAASPLRAADLPQGRARFAARGASTHPKGCGRGR